MMALTLSTSRVTAATCVYTALHGCYGFRVSSTSTSHHRHISCFSTTVIIKVNVIDQDILITTYSFDSLQAFVGGERGDVQRGNC